jgi:hypothetical protein
MTQNDLQTLADRLFEVLGTPATITDRAFHLVGFSVQPSDLTDELRRTTLLSRQQGTAVRYVQAIADRLTEPGRVPGNSALGLFSRFVIPLRYAGFTTGWVYLLDPHEWVTADSLLPFEHALAEAARQVELGNLARDHLHALVAHLLSPDDELRAQASDALGVAGGVPDDARLKIAVISGADLAQITDATWSRLLRARLGWSELAGRLVVIADAGANFPGIEALHSITANPAVPAAPRVVVGVGPERVGLASAFESYRLALRALRFAESPAAVSPVAQWETLGPWRAALLLDESNSRLSLDPRVADFLAGEDNASHRMVQRFLERDNDTDHLAAELHVHRTTLYSRMRKLQRRYGLAWDDPDDRLATIWGIRVYLLNAW